MITHAERAHVGESAASEGSTIYQDDRLSTEPGGILRISSSGLALQLEAQSTLVLRHPANPEAGTTAELASGTLVFSAAQAGNIIVMADDALIRPATKSPAIAHIRVVSRRELRIYAQRGALDFSYHGESATIPEGAAYRVLLDPSEVEARMSTEPAQDKKSPTKKPHLGKFVFIAVGVALGIGIPVLMHALESPDRPGP